MITVRNLDLPLISDKITEGKGNCFLVAILDQCRRPEIIIRLPTSTKEIVKDKNGHMQLRHAVRTFRNTADHPNAGQFRRNYQNYAAIANNESWDQYWERMSQDREWADYIFIQATAWFLNHDIMIITTSNEQESLV